MSREPDLNFCGLSLWLDRAHQEASSDLGFGFFSGVATMEAPGAHVSCRLSILAISTLVRFRRDLATMYDALVGEAVLEGLEPGIRLALHMRAVGHIDVVIEITPNHETQRHHFRAAADQSYLPALITACDVILAGIDSVDAAYRASN